MAAKEKSPADPLTFSATSKKGLQDALSMAIDEAMKGPPQHPEKMVTWRLEKITGRQGGIAVFREVTVTIAVD